jgi:uncharacterized protein YlxP (DUF503 family)
MKILTLEISLRAEWCLSLKDKRSEVKSLLAKLRNKFNVSAAEIDMQDVHKTIVIGVAAIAADNKQADSMAENIISFIEVNSEAAITDIVREVN